MIKKAELKKEESEKNGSIIKCIARCGYTHQYPSHCRFLLLGTIYKQANVQQVKSKASTMSESWQRIGNIDQFFVTAAPTVANVSFSTSEYAILARNIKSRVCEREQKKREKEIEREHYMCIHQIQLPRINYQ